MKCETFRSGAVLDAARQGEQVGYWMARYRTYYQNKDGKNDLKSRQYTGPAWIYEASGESSKGGVGSL